MTKLAKVTPTLTLVNSEGKLTREGFNLFRTMLDRIEELGALPVVAAANIASVSSAINTSGKEEGKMVRDSTNNRIMVARAALPASPWDVADGSASVTTS